MRTFIMILILIALSFSLRLNYLNDPIDDAHAWRQTDTYSIVKNFLYEDFNILHPRIDQITPPTNKERFFMESFPLYEYILAAVFKLLGESIFIARIYSVLIIALTSVALYYIGKKLFSPLVGFVSAITFQLFPASIFWGRALLPDILAIFLSSASFATVLTGKKIQTVLGFILLGLAIAIKPFFAVLLLPLEYFIVVKSLSTNKQLKQTLIKFISFFLLATLPFVLWKMYINSIPKQLVYYPSIWAFFWGPSSPIQFLKNSHWLETLVQERIMTQLTPLGGILLFVGLFEINVNGWKRNFIYLWVASIFISFTLVAQGNVWHVYYQLMLLPLAALIIGQFIVSKLSKKIKNIKSLKHSLFSLFTLLAIIFLVYFLAWIPISQISYFNKDVKADKFWFDIKNIRSFISRKEQIIIVDDLEGGSSTLLNHIDRHGWVVRTSDFCNQKDTYSIAQKYKNLGAIKLVFPSEPYYYLQDQCDRTSVINLLKKNYKIIYTGKNLFLFNL